MKLLISFMLLCAWGSTTLAQDRQQLIAAKEMLEANRLLFDRSNYGPVAERIRAEDFPKSMQSSIKLDEESAIEQLTSEDPFMRYVAVRTVLHLRQTQRGRATLPGIVERLIECASLEIKQLSKSDEEPITPKAIPPLTDREISVTRFKTDHGNYVDQCIAIVGEATIDDVFTLQYETARQTHHCIKLAHFVAEDANDPKSVEDVIYVYQRREFGPALVEQLIQSRELGHKPVIKVLVKIVPAKYAEQPQAEVLDWQVFEGQQWSIWKLGTLRLAMGMLGYNFRDESLRPLVDVALTPEPQPKVGRVNESKYGSREELAMLRNCAIATLSFNTSGRDFTRSLAIPLFRKVAATSSNSYLSGMRSTLAKEALMQLEP